MEDIEGQLSEKVRKGECNHCGWCCTFTGKALVSVENPDGIGDPDFLSTRGFRCIHRQGKMVQAVALIAQHLPCPQFVNGRCAIYENRPTTCRDFPVNAKQIEGTPCSYYFEEVQ